jgi:hypothetical protein
MIHVSSDIPRFDDAKTDRPTHPSTPHAKDRYVGLITKTASNKKQTRILNKSFALGQNVRMARNGSEIYPGSPTTLFSPQLSSTLPTQIWGWILRRCSTFTFRHTRRLLKRRGRDCRHLQRYFLTSRRMSSQSSRILTWNQSTIICGHGIRQTMLACPVVLGLSSSH